MRETTKPTIRELNLGILLVRFFLREAAGGVVTGTVADAALFAGCRALLLAVSLLGSAIPASAPLLGGWFLASFARAARRVVAFGVVVTRHLVDRESFVAL